MATSKDYRRSVIAASDELRDIYCEPCVDDGKQIEAEGFFVDCSEYLCGQCYKHHTRYKAFKHHVLQDKDKMPLDSTKAVSRDVCVDKCSLHTTKIVEYFCRTCDILGCNACMTVNHRQCKNVDHIPDIVNDLDTSEEFKEFSSKLDKNLETINNRKKTLASNTSETDEMKKIAKVELQRQRDEIKKFFDHLQAEMDRRIEDIDKNNKKTLKTAISTCDSIYGNLKNIKSNIDAKLKTRQNCELFIAMKKSKHSMEKVDTEIDTLTEESRIQRYALTPSSEIKNMVQNTSEICRLRSANFVSEINVSTINDKEKVSIFGLAAIKTNYLAILDGGNKSVKMIDTKNMKVTDQMDIKCTHVWHITNVNDDQVAVLITDVMQAKIQLLPVSMSGSLSKGNKITFDGDVNDDLVFKNGYFFVVCFKEVKIIDMKGKPLKTIDTEYAEAIAVSPDQKLIYLTNPTEDTVTRMTLGGKVQAIYKDKDLKDPSSITVDNEGFVYVRGSENVHQLSENCTKVQVLLEETFGTQITYSNSDNKLYLGCKGSVHVYQMK